MIKLFKKYLIDSEFYVSLMGTLLTVFFMLEQNSFRPALMAFIFLTYFSGYLYTKYQNQLLTLYPILILNFLSFAVCSIIIIYHQRYEIFPRWLVIILLGILYNSNFLGIAIRKLPFMKIFYVGLVWGLINSWLLTDQFQLHILVICILFVSALIIPFDIRDLRVDRVLTFPKALGIQNSKWLAAYLNLCAATLAYFTLAPGFGLAFLLSALATFLFIYFTTPRRSALYFSFGVESLSGLPLLFYFLLS